MGTIIPVSLVFLPEDDVLPCFSVRLENTHGVAFIDLKSLTLPAAVREAISLGHWPTHWVNCNRMHEIPASVR